MATVIPTHSYRDYYGSTTTGLTGGVPQYYNTTYSIPTWGTSTTATSYTGSNSTTTTASNWSDYMYDTSITGGTGYRGIQGSGGIQGSVSGTYGQIINLPLSKTDQWREKFRNQLAIHVKSRIDLPVGLAENERVAMETLRETMSETDFRKYLKFGFILVKGKSGDVFQVFKNKSHTKVWRGGQLIEEVCVRINSAVKVPATDNVIAFTAFTKEEYKDQTF